MPLVDVTRDGQPPLHHVVTTASHTENVWLVSFYFSVLLSFLLSLDFIPGLAFTWTCLSKRSFINMGSAGPSQVPLPLTIFTGSHIHLRSTESRLCNLDELSQIWRLEPSLPPSQALVLPSGPAGSNVWLLVQHLWEGRRPFREIAAYALLLWLQLL